MGFASDVGSQIVNSLGALNQLGNATLDGLGEALHLGLTIDGGRALPPAASTNAIFAATGTRIRSLPVNSDKPKA